MAVAASTRGVIRDPREAYQVLKNEREIAFDIETSGLSPYRDRVMVLTLQGEVSERMIVLQVQGVIPDPIIEILSDPTKRLTGHNMTGFDALFLLTHGVDMYAPEWFDTMVAEGVLAVSGRHAVSVSLRSSLKRRLKVNIVKDADHGQWSKSEDLTAEQLRYVVDDVASLHRLRRSQLERAEDSPNGTDLRGVEFEMELCKHVVRMSLRGMPLDLPRFEAFLSQQKLDLIAAEGELFRICGYPLNSKSVPQVLKAFADRGVALPSTGVEVLSDYREREDEIGQLADNILVVRGSKQRLNMYTPEWVETNVIDNTLHPRYWQVGTDTNRFSSSDPNFQQWPVNMRPVIGGWEGHTVVKSDYDALEMRMAASVFRDPNMRKLFEEGWNPHDFVATNVYGCEQGSIPRSQRQAAKAGNFCIAFGGGAATFQAYAHRYGSDMSLPQAEKFLASYLKLFPGIAAARARASQIARGRGAITLTLPTGIRRVLAGPTLTATRILNTSVQGPAACGIKYAILECHARGIGHYLAATVHDELVVTPENEVAEEVARELEQAMIVGMQRAFGNNFPIACEVKSGSHWQS